VIKNISLCVLLSLLVWTSAAATRPANDEREVRQAAQRVFNDLKQKHYEDLYNSLPESSRKRVTKDRFVTALTRTEDFYRLDRLEIGAIRVSGDFAVADTTMYGHVLKPFDSDGKIIAQQYLVKEGGSWKVATGDRALIQNFLTQNPEFAKKFPVRPSRVLINRDGKWVDVTQMGRRRPSA